MSSKEENPARSSKQRPPSWRALAARIASLESASRRAATSSTTAEGTRLVERALRASHPIQALLVGADYGSTEREATLLTQLEAADIELLRAPEEALKQATGGRSFGSILALISIPKSPTLEQLMSSQTALLLVAADVQEAGNNGALVRTAHALGATAFAALGNADPWHPKAVRTSKGSLFSLPVLRDPDATGFTRQLGRLGVSRFGLCTTNSTALEEAVPPDGPRALFVGSEAHGLSAALCGELDALVHIRMVPGVDSLSVNAAAAIGLHELRASS